LAYFILMKSIGIPYLTEWAGASSAEEEEASEIAASEEIAAAGADIPEETGPREKTRKIGESLERLTVD